MRDKLNPGERLRPDEPRTSPWCEYTPGPGRPVFAPGFTSLGNSLSPGGRLMPYQQLRSPNGAYALTMQPDGLLAFSGGPTTLAVPSNGAVENSYAELRQDGNQEGNFVVCDPNDRMLWESGPRGPGELVLHDDGHITIGGRILI